ncbi:uncharacterized protein LOC110465612 [Mizuhopecten yessoensis]|uniref:Uncharacterized protein n=1 Tax=Mizuhopecten yessoensis TaxID=6573 RepID=A0A210PRA2_MIZYE|nr:uncharacterized protein LOC110465612 [Mizuhopecten yessoensis]OWF39008.1 hypothetical protein KP79_PYT05318 [Mizuhopecten yessoensis]
MHPKPVKSKVVASRLLAKKSNAMKEIEEWVMKDVSLNDAASRIGKLPENVTEERMFKSRLFDIGKERYKYLSKNAYEMRMFSDKYKKKMALARQQLQSHHRSLSANDVARPAKSEIDKARLSLDPRMLRRTQDTSHDIEDGTTPTLTRSKTVSFVPTSLHKQHSDLTQPRTSTPARANSQQALFKALREKSQFNSRPLSRGASFNQTPRSDDDSSSKSWVKRNKFSKYGGNVPGVTADPRYAQLEGSLSPFYQGKPGSPESTPDVKQIVNSIGSLHKPSRNIKEVRPKLTLKLQAFMKERGIVF